MTPSVNLRTGAGHVQRGAHVQKRTEIGPWRLVRKIGEGALTEVFQARCDRGSASYALKRLRSQWQAEALAIECLKSEASVGRAVSHCHVIPILAAQLEEPPNYVVMPLLSGRGLEAYLLPGEPVRVPLALWIARQAAEGLGALHASGFMHGDVKPANLFVASDAHVTLLDLGFARPAGRSGTLAHRPVVGSVQYMAPELFSSTLCADIRSDIYSLGVVLFQMLCGRLPFAETNPQDLALAHRDQPPPQMRTLAAQLPSELTHFVHTMLAKEPLRRPQSPKEVVQTLVRHEVEMLGDGYR